MQKFHREKHWFTFYQFLFIETFQNRTVQPKVALNTIYLYIWNIHSFPSVSCLHFQRDDFFIASWITYASSNCICTTGNQGIVNSQYHNNYNKARQCVIVNGSELLQYNLHIKVPQSILLSISNWCMVILSFALY